jgi:LuxR family transcriptional regulator, maltose regulon positive regulatory protein
MTTSVSGLSVPASRGRPGLLADKLEMPALGLAVVARPRLAGLVDQATVHRVTLVTGPAGAGKTVACASWAARHGAATGRQAGWLTLDPGDREPARFWQYLAAALARAGALTAAEAGQLTSGLAERDLTEPDQGERAGEQIARELLGQLGRADRAVVLVLDDVHQLAGSAIIPGLDELVQHAPDTFRLVLAGRHTPGLALAKLRVSGQVGDIGPADLACTDPEADSYLTSMGVAADGGTRAAILRQTEGWMAGLRLVSMTLSDAGEASAGSDQLISDYLCDEMLAPLPAAARELLLRTCLTETVPADLAIQLTGDPAVAARIDQLSRENGLIRPVGSTGSEFRYHPMLRHALETVLHREHAAEVPRLLGVTARWHARREDVLAALRAAAAAGDWDFGVQVLRATGPVVPASADWAALERVLASFPPDYRSAHPALASALAAARLWQDDPDGALPHLDCARHGLDSLDGPEQATARLWIGALDLMRAGASRPDLTEQWAMASRAHEESGSVPEHRATGLLWLALGGALLRQLRPQQAAVALQHATSQLAAGGLGLVRERARSWEAVAHAWYGDLATATRVAAEVAEGPAAGPELAPILAVSQAVVHIARDEPEAAAMLLDQADQARQAAGSPQPAGEPAIGVLTGLARVRIAIDEGNLAGARGLVRLLGEMTAGERLPGAAVGLLDAEISLAAGEPDRARAALDAAGPDGPGYWPPAMICRARLLMTRDDDKGALKVLEPAMTSHATVTERLAALLSAVLAHRRLNQTAEAAERLEEALALAEPDDQSGQFIAAGSAVRSALTIMITPASPSAGFAGRILDRFDGRMPRGVSQPSGAPLTESELAVLRFLPSHMTNQEIAESLFLSINTVKTHLSSVYRKLGVSSRRQAIAQGRRLDLL